MLGGGIETDETEAQTRHGGRGQGEGVGDELRTLLDLRVHNRVKKPCIPVRGCAMILS